MIRSVEMVSQDFPVKETEISKDDPLIHVHHDNHSFLDQHYGFHHLEEFVSGEPNYLAPRGAGVLIALGLSVTLVVAGILAWLV